MGTRVTFILHNVQLLVGHEWAAAADWFPVLFSIPCTSIYHGLHPFFFTPALFHLCQFFRFYKSTDIFFFSSSDLPALWLASLTWHKLKVLIFIFVPNQVTGGPMTAISTFALPVSTSPLSMDCIYLCISWTLLEGEDHFLHLFTQTAL